MSWQSYVDDHLMCQLSSGQHLHAAAIVGQDGSIWAQSANFPHVSRTTATLRSYNRRSSINQSRKLQLSGVFCHQSLFSPASGRWIVYFLSNILHFGYHQAWPGIEKGELLRNMCIHLQISQDEVSKIMAGFGDPTLLGPTGILIGGEKYMAIQSEKDVVLRGKKVSRPEDQEDVIQRWLLFSNMITPSRVM